MSEKYKRSENGRRKLKSGAKGVAKSQMTNMKSKSQKNHLPGRYSLAKSV